MHLNRIASLCIVTVVAIAGCASDPGKKVNSAESELTSEQQKAHADEQDKNAEATRKQETTHAESASDKNTATSEAKKDVSVAHAELAQDRRDFNAKTKERLAKIDAKAKELSTKSAKLTAKKLADYKGNQTTFNTLRSEANASISSLDNSSNDGWSGSKKDVEKKLDNLESALERMGKDL